jgi:hypothetical protein
MKKKLLIVFAVLLLMVTYFIYRESVLVLNNTRFNIATSSIAKINGRIAFEKKIDIDSILLVYKSKNVRANPSNFLDSLENYSKEIKMKYKMLPIKNRAGFKCNLFDLRKNNILVKPAALHDKWKFIDYEKTAINSFGIGMDIDMIEYTKGKADDINVMRNGFENIYEYVWNEGTTARCYTKKDRIVFLMK